MQDVLVGLIVAGAFWHLFRMTRKAGGGKKCGGCAGACGGEVKAAPQQQLVQIQVKKKS